jgi:hypothetical protein
MRNIPCRDCTQGHAVLITAVPLGAGRFEAWCDGRLIVACTREPLLAGARALLAAGSDSDTIAVMRHAGNDIDALTARIGMAARFYVEESAHGPVLRSTRKASPRAVDRPPIPQTRPALIPPRRTAANAPLPAAAALPGVPGPGRKRRNDHRRAGDHHQHEEHRLNRNGRAR